MNRMLRIAMAALPYALVIVLSALSTVVPTTFTMATLFLALAALIIFVLRLDAAELLVATMPLAFYAEFGQRVNLSVSDAFLIVLLLRILSDRSLRASATRHKAQGAYLWLCCSALFVSLTLGLLVRSFAGDPVSWTNYFLDAGKLAIVLAYFCVAFVVFADKLRRNDFRFLAVWTYTAVAVALIGVLGSQLYDRGIDLELTTAFRAKGTFEDPNAFATYLLASLGVSMAWTYLRRMRLLSWHLLPLLVGAYFSYSRAGIVAVVATLAVGFVVSFGSRPLRPFRWIAYLGASVLAVLAVQGTLSRLLDPRRELTVGGDIRFEIWSAGFRVWQQHPAFGVGLGQFRIATAPYLQMEGSLLAHNTFLSFLAEGGVLGLMLFLAIPGAIAIQLLRSGDVISRLFLVSFAAFAMMALSLNLQNFRPMWVFFALALAWLTERSQGESLGSRRSSWRASSKFSSENYTVSK
jgi:O-antigen ligase